MIALGMTFVIVTRCIDLSVGSIAYLSMAVAMALTSAQHGQRIEFVSTWWVYPLALISGLVLGLINAVVVSTLRISPLIATLGSLTLYRGIALHLTGARTMLIDGAVLGFGRMQVGNLGLPVLVAVVLAFLATGVLKYSVFGRYALAIGGNPRSAKETGLPVKWVLFATYGSTGVLAGLAGLTTAGRIGALDADLGFNFEFTVITAVVLGGTSLFGGRGSILGSMLGALLLTLINNGLNLIGADPFYYDLIRGLVLTAAVAFDQVAARTRRPHSGALAVV